MKVFFSAIVECDSCRGTGLYIGMAERAGAAVICHTCKGEGFREVRHEYNQFSGRKHNDKVKRVYKTAGGYCISAEEARAEGGKIVAFHHAGCSYQDWKNGRTPLPIRDLHCPLTHFEQGSDVGEELKNTGPCSRLLSIGGHIPTCSKENREDCWKYFDSEFYNHHL